jgi:hypothetical protein
VTDINTHNLRVDFGKHKGELWTRVPVAYLKWLTNKAPINPGDIAGDIARSELKRRGTVTPTIEVSGHAIDRASLSCRKIWHETRGPDEGLHAWLCRMAQAALDAKDETKSGKFHHCGMLFAFEFGECYPALKTVMPA